MSTFGSDFRKSWLWRQAFQNPRSDSSPDEQEFFRIQYLTIREKAEQLVSRIAVDLPGMTVHDISHLDALWETASDVAEGAVNVNPAEAFVLGASILLHDAAMSLAAYGGGVEEVKRTVAWKDAVARVAFLEEENGTGKVDVENPSKAIIEQVLPDILRQLHSEQAEVLADQAWSSQDGQQIFLIDDPEIRRFYGPTIGQIAHSHWWPIHKVEQELSDELGSLPSRTRNRVDRTKLACMLRVADALHLDSRRAPSFLRTITKVTGISALHWAFQERLARPHVELDMVVFTTGQPFAREDAEAWWLAYDTLNAVDRELRGVDLLLQSRGKEVLRARRVKGAESPEALSRTVRTKGWRPVDARLQVSDVPRIVENLGGSKLYGNDPTVALRELLQNAADAVQARRKFQKRSSNWGEITISLEKRGDQHWLIVEDNGIGMSEQVLTGPLLDFGTSFWRSPMAMEEFPGLLASGMNAIGRFGIGFFSVFMLGSVVRVYSRRCDKGQETGRLLEFRDGTSSRPILSPNASDPVPIDGGTRIEVQLKTDPFLKDGLLYTSEYQRYKLSLSTLAGSLAPNLDTAIVVIENGKPEQVVQPGDWLQITELDLVRRLDPSVDQPKTGQTETDAPLMQPICSSDGNIYGRAFISPDRYYNGGWLTISGLRATRLSNVQGIFRGSAMTAVRNVAQPLVPKEALAKWATDQAHLISNLVKDGEWQAKSAEIVLHCGGRVGKLKILRWGDEWLNSEEFQERIFSVEELAIAFYGDFEYDESEDNVHPREFRRFFYQDANVIVVLKHDGRILHLNNLYWPDSPARNHKNAESNVAVLIRKLIAERWGKSLIEEDDIRIVGEVDSVDIFREVSIFRPA